MKTKKSDLLIIDLTEDEILINENISINLIILPEKLILILILTTVIIILIQYSVEAIIMKHQHKQFS